MNTQPEDLRLADALVRIEVTAHGMNVCDKAAAELRNLHAANVNCVDNFNQLMEERDLLVKEKQDLVNALKMLHEAFCSEDYGTSEGRLQARKALIATRECLKKNEQS